MADEVNSSTMEDRRERVLQALHILAGDEPSITEEEKALIKEYREISSFGYGRMEVVVVSHRLEGINPTRHKKRKDLIFPKENT